MFITLLLELYRLMNCYFIKCGCHVHSTATPISMEYSHQNYCCDIFKRQWHYSVTQCRRTQRYEALTHWGQVTHICVSNPTIIGSDNGLSPWRRQAIIWYNAGILLIRRLGTNFSEILIGIQTFSFKKMHLKMSSAKWRPFCLGLNVLMTGTIHAITAEAMILTRDCRPNDWFDIRRYQEYCVSKNWNLEF